MALATLCPYCHTAFRVANDQLKLHAGLVRCGACQQTFNGIEHLVAPGKVPAKALSLPASGVESIPPAVTATADLAVDPTNVAIDTRSASGAECIENSEPATATPANSDSPSSLASSLEFDLGVDDQLLISTQEEISQFELQTQATLMNQSDSDWSVSEHRLEPFDNTPEQTSAAAPEALSADLLDENNQSTEISADDTEAGEEELNGIQAQDSITDDLGEHDSAADKPDFVVQAEKKQRLGRTKHLLLVILSPLLLLSMLAQGIYYFRNPIAAWLPQTKPILQDTCKLLHCQIELPAQIDMISIESNELQVMATERNVFSLALQLQNKSGTLQSWPMLELILNDSKDKPVLQRVFRPAEYLSNKNDLSKGFPAGSEQSIKLYFELSGLKAAGYHVGMFYP